ncbi:SDR family NAD(P)-dependent oxidoreductase [Marinivivus vitaminiproducens]|uniref:SDR family NAD(P)-dependent oxidoreductase n=1 Tax=Marinivivus vitaminiproducens TaxID=3035935 RepID=UPI0027A1B654|nr:SDR family NAD(P)-dependent oxidoreductase [Geminicoccaceae bacterium SCSIO 64248]
MIPYAQKLSDLRRHGGSPADSTGSGPDRKPLDGEHLDRVLGLLAATLGIGRADVRPSTPFAEMGLSSLLAVRFLDRVNRAFGLRLGVDVLFGQATPEALAGHIAALAPVGPEDRPSEPTPAGPTPARLRVVDPVPADDPADEAIAIVGMAGRFPGACDVEAFWRLLAEGRCAIGEVPAERWCAESFYDPSPNAAASGRTVSKWGGFLRAIDRFDAAFFGISPREAAAMDPQHRLFLEQAWLAFENGGYTADRLKGSATGVFVGASASGYETLLDPAAQATQAYGLTGNLGAMLASRIAYALDLRGPSLVIDTACSASLVALDLACQALKRGDIDLALVGGVALFLDEKPFVAMTRTGMLSPDGRCRSFDSDANGIAVGEAAAAILLKPLAQAQADGDRIDAVIRASGTNQDGRSNGITAPNPDAQTALLRDVHARAGADPASLTYVEAHGTGTPLGDPIEVAALRDALGPRSPQATPCWIGSVKSNVGHTAEAAGLVGLIKTVLCLKHGELVPSVAFNRLNPKIDVGDAGLQVATCRQPWPTIGGRPRRAGVSSFGLSGTNAHVVLEEAPAIAPSPPAAESWQPIVVSARTAEALDRRIEALAAWLRGPGAGHRLADVAATLALGRTHFEHRAAVVARTAAEAADRLDRTKPAAADTRGDSTGQDHAEADALATAYRAGGMPAWPDGLKQARRNLALPGYPFAGPVHWAARRPSARPEGSAARTPHPFAASGTDAPVERRFVPDDPIVRDHVIGGTPVLHASIFLEMAGLAAGRAKGGASVASLRDVVWERTVRVPDEGTTVRLDTAPVADGLTCTMLSGRDSTVAARCRATFGPPATAARIDAEAVKRASEQRVDRATLDGLDRGAVRLGPSFAGFDVLWLAADRALSWIEPSPIDEAFLLPPRLVDAAIQTGAALLAREDGAALRLRYPAGVDRIVPVGPASSKGCLVLAERAGAERLNLTLADSDGVPWLVVTGFAMREAGTPEAARPAAAAVPARTCRIAWHAVDPVRGPALPPDAIIGDLPVAAALADGLPIARISHDDRAAIEAVVAGLKPYARLVFVQPPSTSSVGLLRLAKTLIARGLGETPLELRIVTTGAQAIAGQAAAVDPEAAACQGLAKAIGRECRAWRVVLVDLDPELPADVLRAQALETEAALDGEPTAWRHGRAYRRVLEPLVAGPTVSGLTHGGTYLIAGGMGRVGREVCRRLAETYRARLVLVGRRPLEAERRRFLDELERMGSEVVYCAADITRPEEAVAAVACARDRFGTLDGVIQAVVEPLFARLEQTDEEAFAAALAPKTVGLASLAEATRDIPLRHFVVFSSIGAYAGFPGNVGQASYCAACCFEEAFVASLEAAGRPARLIQWGVWQNEAFAGDGLRRLERQGTYPMAVEGALDSLDRILAGTARQVVHASLSEGVWRAMGGLPAPDAGFAAAAAILHAGGEAEASPEATLHHDVDAYARALVARLVRERNLPWAGVDGASRTAPQAGGTTLPRHARLFEAVLDIVSRAPAEAPGRDALLARALSLREPLELLEVCVAALPDVLSGEREGTDVLFPAGAMDRVEAIYRNQPVLAACNALLARAAASAEPCRVLEVGAGTGATADAVLAALPRRDDIEFHYTDISHGFVRHARRRRADDPRLRFAVLDIERDPAEQDVEPGSVDLVVATNVLHATRDIEEALLHVNRMLRPGGLLLVNEMIVAEDFATLTFGLLEGWWRFRDAERRLPHSPLLDLDGWQAAMRKAGFAHVTAAAAPGYADVASCPQVVLLAGKPVRTEAASTRPEPRPAAAREAVRSVGTTSVVAGSDLERLVRREVAAGLDLDEASIDSERPFGEQGVDSIVAPQIADDIGRAAGVTLRSTDLYNFPTVQALAAHVASLRSASAHPDTDAPTTGPAVREDLPANAVAIVGMAGRFPDAPDLEAFWENIAAGRSAVREIDRFDIGPWYAPGRGQPGKTYAKWAATLEDYDRFDPLFFAISPAEAEAMDPQQRLLLEEAWHAIEDAGLTLSQLDGRHCGVFIGASANSYMAPVAPSLQTLGGSMAILSARLSYFLNLKGPTFPVDTGCSSSLVALHLACRSLLSDESDLALAGGVSCNLLSAPIFTYLSDAGMASPHGRCATFDDTADGFAPGEGVGVVVLKRLADAIRDGDRIHAVVRGTGINQDGKTSGLTAPSASSQTALETQVYRQADIDPATIGLVEAHGTGTKLGDPIEVAALTDAFAAFTPAKGFCAIGSVKTNIGHAMAAAGMAGLLKAVLAVRHRTLPPSLNFTTPNRHIDFAGSPFVVNTETRPWQADHPLRAAISSFGFSGTNAHVVIEQAPEARDALPARPDGPYVFVLSAKTPEALERRIADLRAWIARHADTDPADLAYTLTVRRTTFSHRRAFVAATLEDLAAQLGGGPSEMAAPAAIADRIRRIEAGDNAAFAELSGRVIDVPGYPFERERFWNPKEEAVPMRPPETVAGRNRRARTLASALDGWLTRDHVVQGRAILPGAALLELVRDAVLEDDAVCRIRDVVWSQPIEAAASRAIRLDRTAEVDATRWSVRTDGATHASGLIDRDAGNRPRALDLDACVGDCPTVLDGAAVYDAARRHGFAYGEGFRIVERVRVGEGVAVADLRIPVGADEGWRLHPAILDGALQVAACIGNGNADAAGPLYVPFALGRFCAYAPLTGACRVHARSVEANAALLVFDVTICSAEGAVLASLQGLQARALAPASDDVDTLSFVPAWQRRALQGDGATGTIIAFGAEPACRSLRAAAAGRRIVQIEAGIAFARRSADSFTIDPASPDDHRRVLDEAAPGPNAVLLHLWDLADGTDSDPATLGEAIEAATSDTGLRSFVLAVSAALGGAGTGIARAAFAASEASRSGAAAFARTVNLESSRLRCQAVQLEPVDVARLVEECGSSAHDVEVRYERGERSVGVLEPALANPSGAGAPDAASDPGCDRPVYVITGGTGAIGLRIARHLAGRGPCRLALIGRSPLRDEQKKALAAIEAAGADTLHVVADVTSGGSLRAALDKVRRRFGPIQGVVHAAGLLRDSRIATMTAADYDAVIGPKIVGAIALDRLTADDPLDVFVLFSSTAAAFGSAGQGAYAAANGFLDGFAQHRLSAARPGRTVSVAWPLWQSGGMVPPSDVVAELERRMGLLPMPDDAAFAAFDAAVASDASNRVVLHGRSGRLRRFVAGAASDAAPAAKTGPSEQGPALRSRVEAYLKDVIGGVTKIAPDRISSDERFEAYGIDSMMIVRMNARLEEELGDLPKTLFFEHQTVGELTDRLLDDHAALLARHFREEPSEPADSRDVNVGPSTVPASRMPSEVDDGAIAVIGIAGLYPMAPDLDAFWRNLASGRDCIVEIPADRWPIDGFYDPDRERPETSYSKWGSFIDGVDAFDARFFNISPREADALDPQARKFLEVAWATLEDAGLTRESLFSRESDPAQRLGGVFVGVMYGDYQLFGPEEAARGNLIAPNAAYWNVANRVSHFLDLHGPSMAVDTACSSSLTALHLACGALRNGDCTVAFAGGVNLTLHPSKHWILSKSGFASSDGRCRSFGIGGDGYVPGEGVGAVLLKPLARAVADGDRIHAVIRSSAVNHGGRTNGYTVPNPVAQGRLIATALERGRVQADSISYVEAHGTGTALGDPVEIAGLARAFDGVAPETVPVGSVKSNIGHLEAAAGIAALSKVVLQLRHKALAPSLHAERLNPNLDLAATPFRIQRAAAPWPGSPDGPRRAGISSFGAGGANAHLVVEEAPAVPADAEHGRSGLIVPLSAATAEALVERASGLAEWLARQETVDFAALARTLQVGREAMRHRVAFLADGSDDLARQLRAFASDETSRPIEAVTAWTDGGRIDWDTLAPGPRRPISLPTYPFAKRRCWVDLTGAAGPGSPESAAGPGQDRADRAIACPVDDPLVADHRVGEEIVLAGAYLLEGVRAVASRALGRAVTGMSDIRFLRPTTPGMAPEVDVAPDGGFAIRCGTDIQVSGRAETTPGQPAWPPLDLAAVSARCAETLAHEAVYDFLAEGGVRYGPSYRRLAGVKRGDGECLAGLRRIDDADGWHPALIDAGFQVTFALAVEEGGLLPFTVDRIQVMGSPTGATHVYGRRREAGHGYVRLDLYLVDDEGGVLVAIEGFVARAARRPEAVALGEDLPLRLLAPAWRTQASGGASHSEARVMILADDPKDSLARALAAGLSGIAAPVHAQLPERIEADQIWIRPGRPGDDEIAAVTRFAATIRALATQDLKAAVTVVVQRANAIQPDDVPDPVAAALAAFAKSAGREHAGFRLRVIDVDDVADAAALRRLAQDDGEIAWRGGQALIKRFAPVELPPLPEEAWRPGGVYLIAGGAGGIGLALAAHLVRRAAARVVLLGRRAEDEALRARLDAIGGEVLYLQADLTDPDAVTAAVGLATSRFGAIHGAFHLALAMHDARAVTLTAAQIRGVMAPKTEGTRNLMAALDGMPLDAFVIFSSSNAHTANPGQSAYAAASAAQDAIGLAAAPWPVRIIDWGFWGEVGRVATPEYHASLARIGVYPIRTEEGFATVERLVDSSVTQLVPLRISDAVAEALGVETPCICDAVMAATAARATQGDAMLREAAAAFGAVDSYAATLLLLAFRDLGLLRQPGDTVDAARLAENGVEARYDGLVAAAFDMLVRAGYLVRTDSGWAVSESAADDAGRLRRTLGERRERWLAEQPEVAPYLDLLDACGARIADVLTGKADANDVLFPGGSAHLVEPIYRGNRVVDHFQAIVGEAAASALAERLSALPEGERLRILEIGAGTGGTTASVLPALAPWSARIDYVFTDIGSFFLETARRRFADYPFVDYAVLDIERAPAAQGMAANSFDIVIAANVLHATRDIEATLAHVRALCRKGGVLLLNEATARQDFNTLTFGLTRGWWLFEDAARRMPHAPLLETNTWLEVLRQHGFRDARVLAGGQGALQSVVVAEGDGVDPTAHQAPRVRPPSTDGGAPRMAETLRRTVAKSLRLTTEEVDLDTSFAEYGADSIISVDLVREINEALGIDLKTTALFNYSTVRTLAAYVESEFAAELGVQAEDAAKPVSKLRERSERLREIMRKRREVAADAPVTERAQASDPLPERAPPPDREGDEDALRDVLQRLQAGRIGVAEALTETAQR